MELRLFKILIAKAYFDKGYGLTNYLFKIIAVFGLATQMASETFIALAIYSIGCYALGRLWYKKKYIETENEIANMFNPFVREMREKLK